MPILRQTPPADTLALAVILDRLADYELQAGHASTAERLSHAAAALREVAP